MSWPPVTFWTASCKNVSQGLSQGYSSEPAGAQLVLVSAEPVSIDLDADPPTVVVRACIDASRSDRSLPQMGSAPREFASSSTTRS